MRLENMGKKFTGSGNEAIDVYFDTFQKRYFFQNNPSFSVKINERVIAETHMGLAVGKVIAIKSDYINESKEPLKKIVRIATSKDLEKNNELKKDAIKAGFVFKNKVQKYELNLKLVATEYTFDRKKLVFYFASEDRVDFRLLVKDLAAIFKVRIELRQIGVRDYAKMIGDCGMCGKTLCCKSFMNKFDSVSIKMARDQGISVSPSKMSGVCGRLKCCVGFENEQYLEVRVNYPAVGQKVSTPEGKGNVVSMNMTCDLVFVNILGKGIQKFTLPDIEFSRKEKEEIENRENSNYVEGN